MEDMEKDMKVTKGMTKATVVDMEDLLLHLLPRLEEARGGAALVLEEAEVVDLVGLGEDPEGDVDSEEGQQDLELEEPEEEEDLELEEVVDFVEEEVEWAELDGRREEVVRCSEGGEGGGLGLIRGIKTF